MTRKPETFFVTTIEVDRDGQFERLKHRKMGKRPSLIDNRAQAKLLRRAKKFGSKFDRILVKQFPTNQLSSEGLSAYIEMLMQKDGFIPDLIIIDYADLMKVDSANLRVDTGRIYKDLRGIAVEYNVAMITASQSNRAGEDQRILTMKNFAEDYSKAGISDNVITYNQTRAEKELGWARLYVVKARD